MSKLMIFPWINRKELEKIYKELYSDSAVQQKHALGRVSVWKSRAVHKLPVAVESTAAFVSANLEYRRTAMQKKEDLRLRNLYSFALMRFVNHITEKRQTATYALPVHRLASEVGVPEWIVDLRHEATHGELPALTILKVAADWCLQWLKREFWDLQIADPKKETENKESMESVFVMDVLVAYQQHRYKNLGQKDTREDEILDQDLETIFRDIGSWSKLIPNRSNMQTVHTLVRQLLQDLSDLGQHCLQKALEVVCMRSTACATLVEDGYLVLTKAQLASLDLTEAEILQGDLLLPQNIVSFWKQVLQVIARYDLLQDLLMHLVAMVTEEASLRNKFLLGWIYTVVWHNLKAGKQKGSLFHWRTQLSYKQLLDISIQKPNPFSVQLIQWLLNQIDDRQLGEGRKQNIRELVAMYCNSSEETLIEGDQGAEHSIDDICQAEQTGKASGRWFRCTEPIDWSRCALGLLPNQKLDYKCLELFTEEREEEEEEESMETEEVIRNTGSAITDASTAGPNLGSWSEVTINSIAGQVQKDILAPTMS